MNLQKNYDFEGVLLTNDLMYGKQYELTLNPKMPRTMTSKMKIQQLQVIARQTSKEKIIENFQFERNSKRQASKRKLLPDFPKCGAPSSPAQQPARIASSRASSIFLLYQAIFYILELVILVQ